jgi:hypothetical protein
MVRKVAILPLLLWSACVDYGFSKSKKWDEPLDDSTLLPGDSQPDTAPEASICEDPSAERGMASIDEACEVVADLGTFTPVLLWNNRDAGNIFTTPVVGNLTDDDGDGDIDIYDVPDIVVANIDGRVSVLSGDDGRIHWSYMLGGTTPSTAAIGDLDNDGVSEVVTASTAGVVALRNDGREYWTSTPSGLGTQPICGGVGLYDLDGDGEVEVVLGRLIMQGTTGRLLGEGEHGYGSGFGDLTYSPGDSNGTISIGVAADIDLDGQQELVTGNALYRKDGSTIWYNETNDGFTAIGNFDDDDFGEIVATHTGYVSLLDDDGELLWEDRYTGVTVGPPTVADYDGDGLPEIGVAGNGVYVVIEHDGTLKWSKTTQDYSSGFTGSSVFDFEGDGKAEVVYADENDVWVYDGITGDVRMRETRHSNATCSEYPVIADVDNDGHAEIIFTSSYESEDVQGVSVIQDEHDSWRPARPIWNQHAYSITNVEDDGSIPAHPQPNWLHYNSFRSGDMSTDVGGSFTDAVLEHSEICVDDCDEGVLQVVVRVGNGGVTQLPAGVGVSLYSVEDGHVVFLESRPTDVALAPGETTWAMVFDLDPALVPDGHLLVRVDDVDGLGTIDECHEDNNSWETTEAACP